MTPAEFRLAFPAFTGKTDPVIQAAIDGAVPMFDVTRWDDLYTAGLGNYVAHTLFVADQDSGIVTGYDGDSFGALKRKAGDTEIAMSEKVMLAQMQGNPYLRTNYGQQYLYLRRLVGIGALSV